MAMVRIPYARDFVDLYVDDRNLIGVLASQANHYQSAGTQEELVRAALENPIASPRLCKLAVDRQKIVIITSDHTRPVPSKITLPLLLEEIRKGNPAADITILIATGFHRLTTADEMLSKFGEKLVRQEKFINHNCRDEASLVDVGLLPSGGRLRLNRLAVEADLLVSEGFIEPHFFAGFSGGRKSVMPGVASATTVLANHCAQFIASDYARAGILTNNPIHIDMRHAARIVNLAFIMNVVIDAEKRVIKAFAGHMEEAHLAGCKFVSQLATVKAIKADIVVTSNGGYPLDQNIYQAVKGMTAAEATCKEGGVIIIASACNDGHGGKDFYDTFLHCPSAETIYDKIMRVRMEETVPDQWESQILARILVKHKVILVSSHCDPSLITNMHMLHAYTLQDALAMAYKMRGDGASVVVVPDGVSVIVSA